MWKRIGLLLVLSSILLSACSSGQSGIVLERERIDAGEVVNGEIVTRQISVSNEGNVNLVIDAVTTSCGCTKATLEPMTIPPGGSGVLTIEFDSGAHGEELTGSLVRQIFIASNDPQRPEIKIELAATVLAKKYP
ncbi:MAG TPA: DUF1573 domain-containing protein [Anaerolineales bacterium]|jgi:P pilus assembly chaperone PapD|nr:DUF1573 domain-containing protein [Anaerolineales bacterium]